MADDAQITYLTFTPDNPCNTTITSSTGDALYSVVTEHTKKATFTTVRNAQEELIGSLEWRDVLPDRVTVGDNRPVSLLDWMKRSKVPFKDYASFTDDQGRRYRWKGNSPGSSLELYAEDDKYTAPIARYNRSRRIHPSTAQPTAMPSVSLPPSASMAAGDPKASMLSLSPTLAESVYAQSLSPTLTDPNEYTSPETLSTQPRQYTPATLACLPRALEIRDLVVMSFLFLEKNRRSRDRGGYGGDGMKYGYLAVGSGVC